MKRSTDSILATHTGSLPRSDDLLRLLRMKEEGGDVDAAAFQKVVVEAVEDTVARQIAAGLSVVNDGEQGKPGYTVYIKDRLEGFGGDSTLRKQADAEDFPEFYARQERFAGSFVRRPACVGPVAWKDRDAVFRDIEALKIATEGVAADEMFMTAPSPGVAADYHEDRYYGSEEAYVYALADVLKHEYDAIHEAGFLLQIDCPDLASSRGRWADLPLAEFRKVVALHLEALNHALRDIPPEGMRLHVCWGNAEAPHHKDVPLRDIINLLLDARPAGLSIEGANPRHEHEWRLFEDVKLPEGKVLIPGFIDSTTNFVEHPELVSQRILRYTKLVGRQNVLAGTDCGFGTNATDTPKVDSRVAWAKLAALGMGARLATRELWG